MAEGARGRILSGARARLLIDNKKIGYVTGLDVNQEVQLEAVRPIDTIAVEEFVAVGYEVNWNAEFVRVVKEDAHGRMWFQSFDELVEGGREMTMQVLDKVEDTVTHSLEGVKVATHNFRVAGRTLASRQVSGVARVCKLETQPDLVAA